MFKGTATSTDDRTQRSSSALAGNRLVLLGAVSYFCEWVAIIGAGGISVLFKPGTNPTSVLQAYVGHSDAFAWAAGWFSVVLLGRVLFAVAVRHALARSGHQDPVADLGVLAMTVGVVFEVAAYALVMGAAILADHGAKADVVTAIDASASSVESMLWGPTGLAVVSISWAMLRSGMFSRALSGIGLFAGTLMLLEGLAFSAPRFADVQGALQIGVPLMWLWMIWTGVVTWRRAASS